LDGWKHTKVPQTYNHKVQFFDISKLYKDVDTNCDGINVNFR
jgi:hypothetical protein